MLKIQSSKTFKKDLERSLRRGESLKKFQAVLSLLVEEKPLPRKYRDHALSGNYSNCRDCHISPDWVLIYHIDITAQTLQLIRLGTHSDLF